MTTSVPLKWHGGKYYLADRIIGLMPPHIHYVEPYFGGGQVLFRKSCKGVSEVVNDINGDLMNFWNVLGDDCTFQEMVHTLERMPFSEPLYEFSVKLLEERTADPVDLAVAFFVKYRQSRQGLGKCFATLSRNRLRRGFNEQVSAWQGAIEGLPDAHRRLRQVVVLNRDAIEVIRQQDGPNTLFYLDPPYLHETRTATDAYKFEMTREDHLELLRVLKHVKGQFILSGYPSILYDGVAKLSGWSRIETKIDNKASSAKTKQMKTECLWMNFVPGDHNDTT